MEIIRADSKVELATVAFADQSRLYGSLLMVTLMFLQLIPRDVPQNTTSAVEYPIARAEVGEKGSMDAISWC